MEMVVAYSAEDWHMIREMRENGMSISGIARTMGISRATVRKYLSMEKPAKYSRKGRRSIIAPYTAYVRDRIDRYNLSAVRIYEELREKGYPASYTTVKDLCRNIRRQRSITAVYRYETEPGNSRRWISVNSVILIWMGRKGNCMHFLSYLAIQG